MIPRKIPTPRQVIKKNTRDTSFTPDSTTFYREGRQFAWMHLQPMGQASLTIGKLCAIFLTRLFNEGLMWRDLRVLLEYSWRNEDVCHLWISASAILHLGDAWRFAAALHLCLSLTRQQRFTVGSRASKEKIWTKGGKKGLCITVGVSRSKDRYWKTGDGSERWMLTDLDFLLNVSCVLEWDDGEFSSWWRNVESNLWLFLIQQLLIAFLGIRCKFYLKEYYLKAAGHWEAVLISSTLSRFMPSALTLARVSAIIVSRN